MPKIETEELPRGGAELTLNGLEGRAILPHCSALRILMSFHLCASVSLRDHALPHSASLYRD